MPHTALMTTYGRFPVAFVRGQGTLLWDDRGRQYLDFLSGLGVHALGHCPPTVVAALQRQAESLMHVSNLYRAPWQEQLARRLTATCFADQAFFANSGAEANEAAIKLTRKYMKDHGHPGRFEIITMQNSFHGRTLATLAASGQYKVHAGYDPLPPGFRYAPYNDTEALERLIGPYTAAIMVEPIQVEAGIRLPSADFLPRLREIADRHGLLLIVDEIQTGLGRTGRMWCHQWCDVQPDILTHSRSLAAGLPLSVCMATSQVAQSFTPGSHGSSFGGNPMVCAAALATLDQMDEAFFVRVRQQGEYLLESLRRMSARFPLIKEVRGKGLLAAVCLNAPGEEAASIALSRGLLINCVMGTVLRIMPPLTVSREEIDQAVGILDGVFNDMF
ncbi:MAG: aspartate aminotransferase family protein [Magnetococcus sp. WYHC-3]